MARIRFQFATLTLDAELLDTPTARAIAAALPISSLVLTWGEEVYFEMPVKAALEEGAKQVVPPGTVCFWTEGNSLALAWGRTPVSESDESRLVSRCNVLGAIDGDPRRLASVRSGDGITVSLE